MRQPLIYLSILIILSSCGWGQPPQPQTKVILQCAEVRLASGFYYHENAKDYLKSYYRTRKESELFYAWYAAEDSKYMANSVRKCYDKKNKHYYSVKNLSQKNRVLQRLIMQNMRQDAQAQLSELFLEDYRQIFVRDIQ